MRPNGERICARRASEPVRPNVRSGSWLCKNALVVQLASEFNLEAELNNIILVAFRFFEFLHSQGQKLKSSRRAYVFRFAAKNGHRRSVLPLTPHRFVSLTTLLAAGCSAGPSEGKVLRVIASVWSGIDAA